MKRREVVQTQKETDRPAFALALAECVRAMSMRELKVFGAALEVEEPCSFHEAGTIAMDIYDYELVDGSERGYAITALRYAGAEDEILEILEGFTDFDALGRAIGAPAKPNKVVSLGRGAAAKRARPAACGGARDAELAATRRTA